MSASTAGCTRALLALALAAALTVRHAAGQTDAFQHDRPGRPTVDSVHVKTVGVACSSPYTLTQLTSPVFDSYLAALSNVFTPTAPLLLSAKCRTAVLSGVANCLYGLTAALESGALALLTNLQVLQAPVHMALWGFAGLDFQQCSLALGGGASATSATCWADSRVGATVAAASPIPETLLGPTLFVQALYDANPAVGGTGVGGIDIRFVCKYL